MIKSTIIAIAMLTAAGTAKAQNKQDQQSLQALCGCFEIEFKYAETFSKDTAYKAAKPYYAEGLEWVVAEESTTNKWVMQHLLVAGDSFIVKHWREDWTYENPVLWKFNHDAQWKKTTLPVSNVKGRWTQTVWEVNDAPRYQGSATWVHLDGKNYWANTTDAPLPRREYTKRKDYNVLERTNRLIITDSGWTHEQDNQKIVRVEGTPDKVIAQEKGYNIYHKTDDSKCKMAKTWWDKNKAYWNTVRASWEELFKTQNEITIKPAVNGVWLGKKLDDLQESSAGKSTASLAPTIQSILKEYIN